MPSNNKCKQCGHFWMSKIDKPVACPRCKRYDWEVTIEELKKAIRFDEGADNINKKEDQNDNRDN